MTQQADKMFDLTGKVALVTGASRGIGESIARTLAAHGAHVIVSSRKPEDCEKVVAAIKSAGGKAEARGCHIGDMDQVHSIFRDIEAAHGRLDILVNNAATNPYFGPILDTDLGAFQKVVDVNIRGYFFMSAQGAKLMAKNGGGAIVNVASIGGIVPGAFMGIYSISKAAVISMTKAFAQELGAQKIRVNALCPGLTATKFAGALVTNDKIRGEAEKRIALHRVAQPDEMAGAVLYLCSPAASYTTGTAMVVDGGMLIG
ncbi:MAG TPA: SDR family oxidoreductase [Verrucomicrobiae bacterium]|nr:SDR family oxidoreductase [Verrucomicrobiae bacterium]